MSLLTVQDLALGFAGRTLFQGVGFQVSNGDRVGLIGPNGSGKTSLMRLLAGEMQADKGDISMPKGARLGYLAQDVQETLQGKLLDFVLHAIPGRAELEAKIAAAEVRLEEAEDDAAAAQAGVDLGVFHGELAELDTRHPRHEAEVILQGLGFQASDMGRDLDEFSGGWRTRAALGALLYQGPDVLLMDEPTNHLDIPSVRWLEGFLQSYPGAMILICHDRDFLNRQIGRILSLEPEGLRAYTGDYDAYKVARAEEKEILEGQARNQAQKVKDAKRFIDRFRYKASKARQAQSKVKLLEKMDIIETYQERQTISFRFPEVDRCGRHVLTVDGLNKAFGENVLYRGLDLGIERGERVAVIGANGAGKTTLLRIIAGELDADGGDVRVGHNVAPAYYAQHQTESLNLRKSILEEIWSAVPGDPIGKVRSVCGAFLFSGDDVDKPVEVLSGGEKARVALAKVLVSRANFLVMDEPTNHLDLESTEVLIDAMQEYGGTTLFVSHNQAFVNRLATKIWDVRDGRVEEYPGSLYEYYEFLERRRTGAEPSPAKNSGKGPGKRSKKPPGKPAPSTVQDDGLSAKDARKARAQTRQARQAKLKPLQRRVADLEKRIAKLEAREAELSEQLADPELYNDKDRSVPLLKEHGEVRTKLGELMGRWEHALEELESVQAELDG